MKYPRIQRWLHWALSVGLTLQLLLSTVMAQPRPGKIRSAFELLTFGLHEKLGMILLLVLFLHWMAWLLGKSQQGISHFFPWSVREQRRLVYAELIELLRFRLPDPETRNALAGAVQGVGIVIASLLALSGSVMFFAIAADGSMSSTVRLVREFHQTLGPVMWAYLALHAGAVLAHVALGHKSLLAIFRLG